jgi:hypothetical protein
MKMPGSDKTVGEMLKDQEKMLKDFYSASDNTIELPQPKIKNKIHFLHIKLNFFESSGIFSSFYFSQD